MKTFNLIRSFVFLLVFTAYSFISSADAQIIYKTNGFLTFGNTSTYHDGSKNYELTFKGNMWINGPATGHFFQIDTNPSNTRLAGHGNQVVFYNTGSSTYNSIQVANVYNYSDSRAKTNIADIKYGLNAIMKLRPVTYSFVNKIEDVSAKRGAEGREIGLLAQEVEAVIPDIVLTDDEGKKLINYTAIIPILIESIQTLKAEVEALKAAK